MSDVDDLLSNYQHIIDELTVVTGTSGVYDVVVDGELVYSKKQTGRHRNDGEILEIFAGLVGADVARYGT